MIKKFFTLILDKIWLLMQAHHPDGSRVVISGECKKCGNCCRNIVLKIKDKYITEEFEFEALKKWQRRYNHFFISGKSEEGLLLFSCKSIGDDNLCKKYKTRSLICRTYPFIKTFQNFSEYETLQNCGFTFKVSKNFDEMLK